MSEEEKPIFSMDDMRRWLAESRADAEIIGCLRDKIRVQVDLTESTFRTLGLPFNPRIAAEYVAISVLIQEIIETAKLRASYAEQESEQSAMTGEEACSGCSDPACPSDLEQNPIRWALHAARALRSAKAMQENKAMTKSDALAFLMPYQLEE